MKQSAPSTQTATPDLESQLSSSKGGGNPLSDEVRSFMEPRFGADFSGVRVHTGSDAVQMNQGVNAQAFAHGSDIYFGAGKAPGKDALTAHELTHVVQQTGGVQLRKTTTSFQQTSSIGKNQESPQYNNTGRLILNKYADFEGMTQHTVQTKTQPPDTSTFWKTWGAQLMLISRAYNEKRYGCWCGPGNTCTKVTNDIDKYCKQHDENYAKAGVNSDPVDWSTKGIMKLMSESGPSVSMWSIEGLKRTMSADIALIAGTQGTMYDLHFYGPSAHLYREMVALVFGLRVTIAGWLYANQALYGN
jgi:hypothetical protein